MRCKHKRWHTEIDAACYYKDLSIIGCGALKNRFITQIEQTISNQTGECIRVHVSCPSNI